MNKSYIRSWCARYGLSSASSLLLLIGIVGAACKGRRYADIAVTTVPLIFAFLTVVLAQIQNKHFTDKIIKGKNGVRSQLLSVRSIANRRGLPGPALRGKNGVSP